jgi:hypothetical protein
MPGQALVCLARAVTAWLVWLRKEKKDVECECEWERMCRRAEPGLLRTASGLISTWLVAGTGMELPAGPHRILGWHAVAFRLLEFGWQYEALVMAVPPRIILGPVAIIVCIQRSIAHDSSVAYVWQVRKGNPGGLAECGYVGTCGFTLLRTRPTSCNPYIQAHSKLPVHTLSLSFQRAIYVRESKVSVFSYERALGEIVNTPYIYIK